MSSLLVSHGLLLVGTNLGVTVALSVPRLQGIPKVTGGFLTSFESLLLWNCANSRGLFAAQCPVGHFKSVALSNTATRQKFKIKGKKEQTALDNEKGFCLNF